MIRAFIAADLPEGIIDGIENLYLHKRISGNDVKWVNPKGIHLTLKFLGYVEEKLIEPVSFTVAGIVRDQRPLELKAERIGAFPGLKNPRVIWLGIHGDVGRLSVLQKEIEKALIPFGFEEEKRAFSPHLTLGRIRQGKRIINLDTKIQDIDKTCLGFFTVKEIIFYQSTLRPDGAVYNALRRFPFRAITTEENVK